MVERVKVMVSIVRSVATMVVVVPVCALLLWQGTALAGASPGETCAAAKQKAAGQKAARKLACYSAYTKSGGSFDLAPCLQKAESKFAAAFDKAEVNGKGMPRGCVTSGDAAALESLVDDFVAAVVTALPAAPAPPSTPTSTLPTATPTDSIPLKSLGQVCVANAECGSSHCVGAAGSGICCASGCADLGPASCGSNGACRNDGAACQLYSASTVCHVPSCSGATSTAGAMCSGTGTCSTSPPTACPNNLACANAVNCATSCTPLTTAGCASPATSTCNAAGTTCLLNTGQSCSADNQCLSGVCTSSACQ